MKNKQRYQYIRRQNGTYDTLLTWETQPNYTTEKHYIYLALVTMVFVVMGFYLVTN